MEFDAADVKRRADVALAAHQNIPDEARKIYLAEIMDWTDYYTENFLSVSESEKSIESSNVLKSIVTLWIEFATMEKNLRQWKRAIQVFDDALNDAIASKSSSLYIAYANYCKERNKPASAQKVYLRGLSANLELKESDIIWKEYLETMRKSGSKELTMEQLYGALLKQVESKNISKPSLEAIEQSKIEQQVKRAALLEEKQQSLKVSEAIIAPVQQVVKKVENISNQPAVVQVSTQKDDTTISQDATAAQNKVVIEPVKQTALKSANIEERQLLELTNLDDISDYTSEKLLTVFSTHPPMLFSAPHIEPMVAGLNILSLTEIKELENYFGTSLATAEAAAMGLGVRERETDSKLELLLDVLESLWTTQAMKERHFDAWFAVLTRSQRNEEYELKTKHGKKVNWPAFRKRCATQREILCAIVNKILFTLLLDQISVISELNMPYFEPSTVLKLQQWPTAREQGILTGTDKTTTATTSGISTKVEGQEIPLTENQEKLKALDSELLVEIGRQSNIVCSLLSFRLRQPSMGMIPPFELSSHSDDVTTTPSAPSSAAALYRAALASQNNASSSATSSSNLPSNSSRNTENQNISGYKRPTSSTSYVEGSGSSSSSYRPSTSSSSSSSRYDANSANYSQLFDQDKQKRKFKRRRYEPVNGGGSVNRSWSIKDSAKQTPAESKEMEVEAPVSSRSTNRPAATTTTTTPHSSKTTATTAKSTKSAPTSTVSTTRTAPETQSQSSQQTETSGAPVLVKESLMAKLAAMLKKAKETKKNEE